MQRYRGSAPTDDQPASRPFAASWAIALALGAVAGCGGATEVRPLSATTPLERGALGPFTVSLTLVARSDRDREASAAWLEQGLEERRATQLAEYRVLSVDEMGWIALHRDAREERRARRPTGATVQHFDAPVVLDNADEPSEREEVVLVLYPLPWFRPRSLIEERMVERSEEYRGLAGLARKYFVLASEDRVGGLYLWRDRESAEAYYDEAWRARVTERYGRPPEISRFEVVGVDAAPSFATAEAAHE